MHSPRSQKPQKSAPPSANSCDTSNATSDLGGQAEAFRQRFGHDPASIHADKIYQTRANRAWCKERGIRLSGKPLGRPRERTAAEKKQQRQDETDRIPIEGKFGNAKRKGTLQRVMAKLAVTSRTVVTIGLIALNLDTLLRFLRALIRQWLMRKELMRAEWRACFCCYAARIWVYAQSGKIRTAA